MKPSEAIKCIEECSKRGFDCKNCDGKDACLFSEAMRTLESAAMEIESEHQRLNMQRSFYGTGLDMERVGKVIQFAVAFGNLKEISKAYREIAYDMVDWDKEGSPFNGIVYQKGYTDLHIEQATVLQQRIRADLDLFVQSVVDGREFEVGYFYKQIEMTEAQMAAIEKQDNETKIQLSKSAGLLYEKDVEIAGLKDRLAL
jgi:hypothetical protein